MAQGPLRIVGFEPIAPPAPQAPPAPLSIVGFEPLEADTMAGDAPAGPPPADTASRALPASGVDEPAFQRWYADQAQRHGLSPDPDGQFYDYRAAFKAGAQPGPDGHWPSQFKQPGHPNEVVGGFNTRTGQRVPGTRRASEQELIASGWEPATARRLAQSPEPTDKRMPLASMLVPGRQHTVHGASADLFDRNINAANLQKRDTMRDLVGRAVGEKPRTDYYTEVTAKAPPPRTKTQIAAEAPERTIRSLAKGYEEGFEAGTWNAIAGVAENLGFSTIAAYYNAAADEAKALGAKVAPSTEGLSFTEQAVYSGVESIGGSAPSLAVGAFLGPGASLALMGATTGGNAYREARRQGLEPGRAAIYGTIDGIIEMATERIPATKLFDDVFAGKGVLKVVANQLKEEIPNEQIAMFGQELNAWQSLPSNKDKSLSAFAAEMPSAIAQTFIATLVATVGQSGGAVAAERLLRPRTSGDVVREGVGGAAAKEVVAEQMAKATEAPAEPPAPPAAAAPAEPAPTMRDMVSPEAPSPEPQAPPQAIADRVAAAVDAQPDITAEQLQEALGLRTFGAARNLLLAEQARRATAPPAETAPADVAAPVDMRPAADDAPGTMRDLVAPTETGAGITPAQAAQLTELGYDAAAMTVVDAQEALRSGQAPAPPSPTLPGPDAMSYESLAAARRAEEADPELRRRRAEMERQDAARRGKNLETPRGGEVAPNTEGIPSDNTPRVVASTPAHDRYLLKWIADELRELPAEQGGIAPGLARDRAAEKITADDTGAYRAGVTAHVAGTPLQQMFAATGISGSRAAIAYDLERYLDGRMKTPTKAVQTALRLAPIMDAAWDGQRFDWTRVTDEQLAAAGVRRGDLRAPVTLPPDTNDEVARRRFVPALAADRIAANDAAAPRDASVAEQEKAPAPADADVSFDTEAFDAEEPDEAIQARTLARVEADLDGFVDRYLKDYGTKLSADDASELFPEYAASPEARASRVRAVRPAASKIMEAAFDRLLRRPVPPNRRKIVVFTSGGNGSGKSSTTDPDGPQAFIWDTTASQEGPTAEKIDRALAAGFKVSIQHVSVDPVQALTRAIVRASGDSQGRTVTLAGLASTHAGARRVLLALADRYRDTKGVSIDVFDNNGPELIGRDLDWLRQQEYPTGDDLQAALQDVLDSAYADGAISEAIYRGFLGRRRSDAPRGPGLRRGEGARPEDAPRADGRADEETPVAAPAAPEPAPATQPAPAAPQPLTLSGGLLEQHDTVVKALRAGTLTLDDFRAAFERAASNRAEITAAMQTRTKADLLKRLGFMAQARYKSEKKEAVVREAYRDLLGDFVLSQSMGYNPMEKDGYLNAVREIVEKTTAADLAAYAAQVAERTAAYKAQVEQRIKAVKNPETLEEFALFVRAHKDGEAGLTDEQRKRYDELRAEKTRAARAAERATAPTVQAAEQQTTATIVETVHTRDKYPLFVVKLGDRVSRDDYKRLLDAAKRMGGWYSAFRGNGAVPGFQFKKRESAEAFQKLAEAGDVAAVKEAVVERREERVEAAKSSAADRLTEMAEKMESAGNESLGRDRQANTARRARMASGAEADARATVQMARTLRNLAAAMQNGDAKHLEGIRFRSDVEQLDAALKNAQYDWARAEGLRFVDSEMARITSNTGEEVIRHAKLMHLRAPGDHMRRLADKMADRPGYKRLAAKLAKVQGEWFKPSPEDAAEIVAAAKAIGEDAWQLRESLERRNRFARMGITDDATLRTALREYVQFRVDAPKVDRVKELERSLAGDKNVGFDFFPTPKPLAERIARALDIQPGMRVLEPSAGKGNLADAVRAVQPDAAIEVVEQSTRLREILEAKGYTLAGRDFDDFDGGPYDRIIMNPPFSNGIDADHVRRAYDLLAPGGKLMAITGEGIFFRSDAKAKAFREWFESVGGESEQMEGAFLDKTEANTTSVNSRLLTIEKPGAAAQVARPFTTDNLADVFDLPAEEATAVMAIADAMGLPIDQIELVKGPPPSTPPDRLEQGRGLFDDDADILDTGEAQPRLPGDVGAVRNEERPTPKLSDIEDEFRLTPQYDKRRAKQHTLFQANGWSAVLNQSAWHGSPHVFEKFSLHAIGSGEGAQAYGWGLYFSSSKKIADWYRNGMSQMGFSFGAQKPEGPATAYDVEQAIIDRYGDTELSEAEQAEMGGVERISQLIGDALSDNEQGDIDLAEARDYLARRWQQANERQRPHWKKAEQLLRRAIADGGSMKPLSGRTYKVEIPEDEDFLDNDRPITQQSAKVKDILKRSGVWKAYNDNLSDYSTPMLTRGSERRGENIYAFLVHREGSEEAASRYLAKLGIAGLRYRGAESGETNYVVFDDSAVQIMEFEQRPPRTRWQDAKASIEFSGLPWLADAKATIRALTKPDVSSPIHELAHVARRFLLNRDMPAEKRRGVTDEDITTIEQWAGAKDGKWDTPAEEKFARGFERYVREGGPTLPSSVRDIFAKLAAWMTEVYQSIAGSAIDVEITPEVRAVFDRLVTRKERLAAEAVAKTEAPKPSGPPRSGPITDHDEFIAFNLAQGRKTLLKDLHRMGVKQGTAKATDAELAEMLWKATRPTAALAKKSGPPRRAVTSADIEAPPSGRMNNREVLADAARSLKAGAALSPEDAEILRDLASEEVDANADAIDVTPQGGPPRRVAGTEPWQQTRAQFRAAEMSPYVEGIKAAIRAGKNVAVRTSLRIMPLRMADHILITASGVVKVPNGRTLVTLTDDQVFDLARQAGMNPPSPMEREYHRSIVLDAVKAGKPVPENVRAEYARDVEDDAPDTDTLDTGEAQTRLPGDVGSVRDEERAQPTEDVPEQTLRLTGQDAYDQPGLGLDPIARVEQKAKQRLKDRGQTDVLFQDAEPRLPLSADDRADLLVIAAAKVARGRDRAAFDREMAREFGAGLPLADLFREGQKRAAVLVDLDVEEYFNFRRLDVSATEKDHLRGAITETVLRTGRVPKERESWEAIRNEAREMAPEVVEQLKPFQEMQAPFRAVRLIARERIATLNQEIYEGRLALEGLPGDSPEALQRERVLAEKERDLRGLLDVWMRQRSEDGRNLAMHRMMVNNLENWYDPTFWMSKARRELGLPVGTQLPVDVWRALQDILNRGRRAVENGQPVEPIQLELSRYLTRLQKSTWLEIISAVRKAGLLTGPKTHARNILGNLAFASLEELSRVPAVVVDFVVGTATGHRTVHGVSARAVAHASREAATRGLHEAKEILKSGSTASSLMQVDARRELNSGLKWLDTYVNTVFRAMGATDRIFKSYAFRRSLEEQAALEAINQGVSPIELLAKPTAEMLARAVADAEFATFNNKNVMAEFVTQGKNALRRHPGQAGKVAAFAIDMAVPFVNTPSNILARMLDYTPGGATVALTRAAIQATVNKGLTAEQQRIFAQGIGRGATGSALIYLGYMLAAAGMASGMGGDDEGDRNVKEAAGVLPGAVKINGRWHQIATFSPAGNLVSLGASIYRSATMPLKDELMRGTKVAAVAARLALDQPMLKGMSDLIASLQRPEARAEAFAAGMAGSFVPTFVNDLASAFDPYRRDTRPEGGFRHSLWTGVAARLPGARNLLPARLTVLGDQQVQDSRAIWDPTIATVARDLQDDVLRELIAHDVGITWPRQTKDETAEAYRQRIVDTGAEIKARVGRLVDSPRYRGQTDERQAEMIAEAIEEARQRVRARQKRGGPPMRPRFQ